MTTANKIVNHGQEAIADLIGSATHTTRKLASDAGDIILDVADSARDKAADLKDKAVDLKDASMKTFDKSLSAAVKLIKQQPLAAVGIAVGVGLGIGYLAGFLIHRD